MRIASARVGIISAMSVAASDGCDSNSINFVHPLTTNEVHRPDQNSNGCYIQTTSYNNFHRQAFYATYSTNQSWAAAYTSDLYRNQFNLYNLDQMTYTTITHPNNRMLLTDYAFDAEGHYIAFAATLAGNFGVTEIYSIRLDDLSIWKHLQGMYRNPLINSSGELVAVMEARTSFSPRHLNFEQRANHSPLSFFIKLLQPQPGYVGRLEGDIGSIDMFSDPEISDLNHLQELSLVDRLAFNADGQIVLSIPHFSNRATEFSIARGYPGYSVDRAYRVTISSDYSAYTVQMFLGQEHVIRLPPPQWAESLEPANEVCLQSDLANWRF